jgi:16S rRNA (guanine527-N7)-methyltransferase
MSDGLRAALRRGAGALDVDLDDRQTGQLLDYLALIQKWNKVYNLTALRSPDEMLTHHMLDSIAVVRPLLRETGGSALRLLDVGSGAGLPGAVIAICCPHIEVDCVDAVAKKAAFIQQVAASLQLPNLRGLHNRVEKLDQFYDVVSSRAFATLADFTALSGAALSVGGVWLAQKGRDPAGEIAALPAATEVFHVEQLEVPGLHAERCIVWLRRARSLT